MVTNRTDTRAFSLYILVWKRSKITAFCKLTVSICSKFEYVNKNHAVMCWHTKYHSPTVTEHNTWTRSVLEHSYSVIKLQHDWMQHLNVTDGEMLTGVDELCSIHWHRWQENDRIWHKWIIWAACPVDLLHSSLPSSYPVLLCLFPA